MTALRIGLRVEGQSDFDFFEILLRRLVESIAHSEIALSIVPAGRPERSSDAIAALLCKLRDVADLFCIHQDADSRRKLESKHAFVRDIGQQSYRLCDLKPDNCIALVPLREMEAWVLADPLAVSGALGVNRVPVALLPEFASPETIEDPKKRLHMVCERLLGRRRNSSISFARVAERIRFEELRRLPEYNRFEVSFIGALLSVGMPVRRVEHQA